MHYSSRRRFVLLRSGSGVTTTTYDLGVGALGSFDALLIHYIITSYSAGNLTIKFSAYVDGYPNGNTRLLLVDNSAWTTGSLSANTAGSLIIAPPIPLEGAVTCTYASTPNMSSLVAVELVSYGR